MEHLSKEEWGKVFLRLSNSQGLICDTFMEREVFNYILNRTVFYHKLIEGSFYVFDFRCGNDKQGRCPHPQHRTSFERALKSLLGRGVLVMTPTGKPHVFKVRIEVLGIMEKLLSIEMKHPDKNTRKATSIALSGLRSRYRDEEIPLGTVIFRPEVEKLLMDSALSNLSRETPMREVEVRNKVREFAKKLEKAFRETHGTCSQALPTGRMADVSLQKIREFQAYCKRQGFDEDETLSDMVRAWPLFYDSKPVDKDGKSLSIGKDPRAIDFLIYHRSILYFMSHHSHFFRLMKRTPTKIGYTKH
jgi:hypothetical protein